MTAAEARGADVVLANTNLEAIDKIHAAAPQLKYVFDTVVTTETSEDCCVLYKTC